MAYHPGVDDAAREQRACELIDEGLAAEGRVLVLTGAGISAESGLPTFRGPEGYWTIGSENYRPEDLATHAAWSAMPDEVWAWYLYRRGVYRAARPNLAHDAIVEIERALGDRFLLVTQNVDGLHRRAGSSEARTYAIHGDVEHCRCEDEHPRVRPVPESIAIDWPKARKLGDAERAALRCCDGERWSRPHVLFFDESYDEELFRWESTLAAALSAAVVVVVGTSGSTNLPTQIVMIAARRGIPLVVVNRDESPFPELASRLPRGVVLPGAATRWMPVIARAVR